MDFSNIFTQNGLLWFEVEMGIKRCSPKHWIQLLNDIYKIKRILWLSCDKTGKSQLATIVPYGVYIPMHIIIPSNNVSYNGNMCHKCTVWRSSMLLSYMVIADTLFTSRNVKFYHTSGSNVGFSYARAYL